MKFLLPVLSLAMAYHLSAQTSPAPAPATKAAGVGLAARELAPEEIAAERDKFMHDVLVAIAGREAEPAEKVFKNIQRLKGMPAGRVPRLMNWGFGRALGVSCTHCHVPGEWDKDDKPQKQIAREMWDLTAFITNERLPLI